MLTASSANAAMAASDFARCANAADMLAVRAAAVQQTLVVAAISCRAMKPYQDFVMGYRQQLQESDLALQNFFRRLNDATGTADYHAFKTHLANAAAILPSQDAGKFCAGAKLVFDAAFRADYSLTAFLAHQATAEDKSFPPCDVQTVGMQIPARQTN
jgi:hypothetical protein